MRRFPLGHFRLVEPSDFPLFGTLDLVLSDCTFFVAVHILSDCYIVVVVHGHILYISYNEIVVVVVVVVVGSNCIEVVAHNNCHDMASHNNAVVAVEAVHNIPSVLHAAAEGMSGRHHIPSDYTFVAEADRIPTDNHSLSDRILLHSDRLTIAHNMHRGHILVAAQRIDSDIPPSALEPPVGRIHPAFVSESSCSSVRTAKGSISRRLSPAFCHFLHPTIIHECSQHEI